ncbi:hypothetical protein MTO96_002708 [Rhipicephalus appendiculatus]
MPAIPALAQLRRIAPFGSAAGRCRSRGGPLTLARIEGGGRRAFVPPQTLSPSARRRLRGGRCAAITSWSAQHYPCSARYKLPGPSYYPCLLTIAAAPPSSVQDDDASLACEGVTGAAGCLREPPIAPV